MHSYYDLRENAVKKCIEKAKKDLENLKANPDAPRDQLKEKNYNLRIFEQELAIENIVRSRALKVFFFLILSKLLQTVP